MHAAASMALSALSFGTSTAFASGAFPGLGLVLGVVTDLRDERGELLEVFRYCRTMTLLAARAAGVEPIDSVFVDLRDRDDQPLHGEVVICLDEAADQAAHRNHPVRLEVLLYAVHGLLHLLGYDDRDRSSAARMHRREDRLLTQAGLGTIYYRKN